MRCRVHLHPGVQGAFQPELWRDQRHPGRALWHQTRVVCRPQPGTRHAADRQHLVGYLYVMVLCTGAHQGHSVRPVRSLAPACCQPLTNFWRITAPLAAAAYALADFGLCVQLQQLRAHQPVDGRAARFTSTPVAACRYQRHPGVPHVPDCVYRCRAKLRAGGSGIHGDLFFVALMSLANLRLTQRAASEGRN